MQALRTKLKMPDGIPPDRRRDLIWYAAVFLAPLMIFTLILAMARVSGSSMLPGLKDGDFIVCLRHAEPGYGDVVLLREPSGSGRILVKRVEGLPGDEIGIFGGVLYRNGAPVDEPYLDPGGDAGSDFDAVTVPDGEIFVLGDNRYASMDSRSDSLGCVGTDRLIGRLLFRLGGAP